MIGRAILSEVDAEAAGTHSTPRHAALGLIALLALGGIQVLVGLSTGQLWLVLIGGAQVAVILLTQSRRLPAWTSAGDWQPAMNGLRSAGDSASRVAAATGRMIRRLIWAGGLGLAAASLVLGWFAFEQPDLWRWGTLREEGPPLGAAVVTLGTGLLVMQAMLWFTRPRKDSAR